MKRVIIVHCWGGNPNYCWYPWVKKGLEAKGFEVLVPAMPNTDEPRFKEWLSKLKEVIGEVDENTYLIGHSLGCITILRFLEQLSEDRKIAEVVLVAGFTDSLSGVADIEDELESFFATPILWEEIKSKADRFIAIHSDNDPYVDLKYGDEFKEKLSAELIIKDGMNHFSGPIDEEESCKELPDVVNVIE